MDDGRDHGYGPSMLVLMLACAPDPAAPAVDPPPSTDPLVEPPDWCQVWDAEPYQADVFPTAIRRVLDGSNELSPHPGATVLSSGSAYTRVFPNVDAPLTRMIAFEGTPWSPEVVDVTLEIEPDDRVNLVLTASAGRVRVTVIERVPGTVQQVFVTDGVELAGDQVATPIMGYGAKTVHANALRALEQALEAGHGLVVDSFHTAAGPAATLRADAASDPLRVECGTSEGGVPADALDLDWLNDTCPQLGDAQTVCGSTTEDGPILFDAERRASCQVAWDGGPDAPMSASSLELSGEVLYGCTQASNDGVLYRADLVTGEIELTFQPCRGVRTTPCGLLLDQTVDPLPDDQDSRLVLFSSFEDARCNEGGRAIRHLSTRHGAFDVRGSTVTLWDERQDQLVDGNLFGGSGPEVRSLPDDIVGSTGFSVTGSALWVAAACPPGHLPQPCLYRVDDAQAESTRVLPWTTGGLDCEDLP